MNRIKKILIKRDNLSSNEADILIAEAQEVLHEYLVHGDSDAAYNICYEYFGLEPDYLDDLMF